MKASRQFVEKRVAAGVEMKLFWCESCHFLLSDVVPVTFQHSHAMTSIADFIPGWIATYSGLHICMMMMMMNDDDDDDYDDD